MEPKTIATNKKAFRNYHVLDKTECGIVLKGGEVKSLRAGEVNFKDSFARIENGEAVLYNLHISPYEQSSRMNDDPDRERKLLLHKKEIRRLFDQMTQKRLNLIPTRVYFNRRGMVKVELALGKSKKLYDKREDIKKRDIDRQMKRALRIRQKR